MAVAVRVLFSFVCMPYRGNNYEVMFCVEISVTNIHWIVVCFWIDNFDSNFDSNMTAHLSDVTTKVPVFYANKRHTHVRRFNLEIVPPNRGEQKNKVTPHMVGFNSLLTCLPYFSQFLLNSIWPAQ